MFLSMGGINHQTMGGFLLLCCLLNLFIGLPEGREILFVFFGGGGSSQEDLYGEII